MDHSFQQAKIFQRENDVDVHRHPHSLLVSRKLSGDSAMERFFGGKKEAPPPPSLDEVTQRMDVRLQNLDARIQSLDNQLMQYQKQLSMARVGHSV
jgi:hypothetical protein